MKEGEVKGDVTVNRKIMLELILKIHDVWSNLDRPVENGDKGWSVGERVKVA
jgi:hypothetical protein